MSSIWNSDNITQYESRQQSRASGSLLSIRSSVSSVTSSRSTRSPLQQGEEGWIECLTANLFKEPLENRYLCVNCLRVLLHPVALSGCEHHVCNGCLGDVCRKSKSRCPKDTKRFNRHECLADDKLEREINKLELECPHKHCGCAWTGILENYRSHYDICIHTEVQCPNGCRFRTPKRQLEHHLSDECPLRSITCEFCKRSLVAQKEVNHLKDCPKLPVNCPKSCGKMNIPRDELNDHINSECTLAEFECPYTKLGCLFQGNKNALLEHVEKSFKEHISILCDAVSKHTKSVTEQDERLAQLEKTIAQQQGMMTVLNRETETQLLWKIDKWSTKMSEAKSGKRLMLHSVPFHSGRHQYKLGLTLFPNGDRSAKGKFISLYVRICKGEYDSLLSWPFAQEMDLIVIDQSQDPRWRNDFTYTLRPNPCKDNLPFLGKPTAESNPAFGMQNYLSFDLLNTRDYIRDDVVFIRVCVRQRKISR